MKMTITNEDLKQAAKEYYTALDKWEKAKTKWKTTIREAKKEVTDAYYDVKGASNVLLSNNGNLQKNERS